jgi:hypothetical protein
MAVQNTEFPYFHAAISHNMPTPTIGPAAPAVDSAWPEWSVHAEVSKMSNKGPGEDQAREAQMDAIG